MTSEFDVIVVGGGAAGIGAVRRLVDSGASCLLLAFENRLFFAGEATHPFDFTTAHGAHDSGQRAADEALAALRNSHVLDRRDPAFAA